MNRKLLSSVFALALLSAAAHAQTPPAPPTAPEAPVAFATTFFDGDNFLGIHPEEITRENMGRYGLRSGEPRGVGVREVVKGSPAERAGLRNGDVIVRFDGEPVTSIRKLNRLIDESAPEHTARLTVARGGSEQEVSARLGKREGFAPTVGGMFSPRLDEHAARGMAEKFRGDSHQWNFHGDELRKQFEELQRDNPGGNFSFAFGPRRRVGVATHQLGKQLADYFGVSHGVLVSSVEAGSPADKAGLKAGDIITEADGERIEDAGDLSRVINRKEEGEVTLTVVRDKNRRTVRVTPERREPHSFYVNPGSVHVAPPAAALAPRRSILDPPPPPRAPRVRLAPRLRMLRGLDGRVM